VGIQVSGEKGGGTKKRYLNSLTGDMQMAASALTVTFVAFGFQLRPGGLVGIRGFVQLQGLEFLLRS
jgi:hypothetical protein